MTLQEIKDAVDAGKKVNWNHSGYQVVPDNAAKTPYTVVCIQNGSCCGLERLDNGEMIGEEQDFFISE